MVIDQKMYSIECAKHSKNQIFALWIIIQLRIMKIQKCKRVGYQQNQIQQIKRLKIDKQTLKNQNK
ncbi:unnamed protein product [Paramecium pentaurelia]|uniref:Uncharacterized protein n=1 Tax=Paramecium pentaurelia TaxID=43138 RepID=A0A8S1UYX7_9CILI|nr:unnamed protein product [Paramecium pentaurelia]